jgi:hypothetical protein
VNGFLPLAVPVGTRTRLTAVEFVAQLAGLFQLFGVGRGAAFGVRIARRSSFAGRGAFERGLKVTFAESHAGGEAVE